MKETKLLEQLLKLTASTKPEKADNNLINKIDSKLSSIDYHKLNATDDNKYNKVDIWLATAKDLNKKK